MIEHQHERELPEGVPRRTQQNWEFSALAVQLNEVTMPNCIVVHEFCQAAAFDQLTTMGETLHHGMSPVSCIVVQSAGTALVQQCKAVGGDVCGPIQSYIDAQEVEGIRARFNGKHLALRDLGGCQQRECADVGAHIN